MKKIFIVIPLILAGTVAFSQFKIGLKISPGILLNRAEAVSDSVQVSDDGSKFTLPFGIFIDLPLTERYFISTGLNLVTKNANLNYAPVTGFSSEEDIRLQYLQIPITAKLYTDEVGVDKRFYFQFGPTFDILISQKNKTNNYIKEILFGDISFLFSGGFEMKVGPNTAVSAGVSYLRGLVNIIKTHDLPSEDFILKNDLIMIDIGLKL